jgi:hypothetical protein
MDDRAQQLARTTAAVQRSGGGFDVVLGNPPWETLSPDAKEYFAAFDNSIRFQDKETQAATIAHLSESPGIGDGWRETRRGLFATAHFLKESGRFRMYAEGNLGKGDFNVYRMFVELALTMTRCGGRAAQIVPEGLYNGANCAAIRMALFEECQLQVLYGFENAKEGWFKGIDTRMKFAMYVAEPGGETTTFKSAFNVRSPEQLKKAVHTGGLTVPVTMVHEFSPDALAIMEFADQREVDIATKMYARWPKFGDADAGPPHRTYMRELDMGADRDVFADSADGVTLYEGRMVDHFDHRAKGYRNGRGRAAEWEELPFGRAGKSIQPQWRVPLADVPVKVRSRIERYRVGFCDVASPTNERSLCGALLPPGVVAGHKVPTITFEQGQEWVYMVWLAVANSFVVDFIARKKVSLSMSYTVLDSLPFPRFAPTAAAAKSIVPLALKLTCCGPEMRDYWNAMAAEGWCAAVAPDDPDPGEIDEVARAQLRAELDAIVGRDVYGLTAVELGYVLDTFPIVRERDLKAFGEFRTKRLVLEAYQRAFADAQDDSQGRCT